MKTELLLRNLDNTFDLEVTIMDNLSSEKHTNQITEETYN